MVVVVVNFDGFRYFDCLFVVLKIWCGMMKKIEVVDLILGRYLRWNVYVVVDDVFGKRGRCCGY